MLRRAFAQVGLLGREDAFRSLAAARAGSALGSYLAAIALQIDVFDRTHSGLWISALLIAQFLPGVVIGLTLGPLLDRWERKRLMILSDAVSAVIFALLPFTTSAGEIVALALVSGVANGVFRPIVYAGLPNLVAAEDLEAANSVLQTIENLAALVGPPVGGLIVALTSPHANYWINAASFVLSVAFVLQIPPRKLQVQRAASKGHWKDLRAGFDIVRRAAPLLTVLVTWTLVAFASGAVNTVEVILAKKSFNSGDVGFGVLVAGGGLGLAIGSFLSGQVMSRIGLAKTYAASIAFMGGGIIAAAASPNVWVAAVFAIPFGAGNGAAVVCNFLFISHGAADELRGRAVAVLTSVTQFALFVGMVVAGPLVGSVGPRWMWGAAGALVLAAALVGARLGGRVRDALPPRQEEELPPAAEPLLPGLPEGLPPG